MYRVQFCEKRDFGRLRRSAAAHTAENEAKQVLLMLTEGKDILSMERHEGLVGTQQRQNMKKEQDLRWKSY